MVVAIDGSWKISIGSFFIAHIQSEEKAKLVELALRKLNDVSIKAISVTCDCPNSNWATLKN